MSAGTRCIATGTYLGCLISGGEIVRAALERIIEQAGEVDATAAAVVAAIQAYSKINAAGQWVERTEHVNLNELFDRMTREELEAYAKEGALPGWFESATGAADTRLVEGPNEQ